MPKYCSLGFCYSGKCLQGSGCEREYTRSCDIALNRYTYESTGVGMCSVTRGNERAEHIQIIITSTQKVDNVIPTLKWNVDFSYT